MATFHWMRQRSRIGTRHNRQSTAASIIRHAIEPRGCRIEPTVTNPGVPMELDSIPTDRYVLSVRATHPPLRQGAPMPATFNARIARGPAKTTTGIVVPPEVIAALGKGSRPPVLVTVRG
jgi:hypothetical protein